MNIEYNGYSYFTDLRENENKNSLIERSWYIAKKLPITENKYNIENQKSNLYVNINRLKCTYNHSLEKNI